MLSYFLRPASEQVRGGALAAGGVSSTVGGVSSASLAVFLADVAHPGEAVQVVETPVVVEMGAVLVPVSQAVARPAVRLSRAPAPGRSTTAVSGWGQRRGRGTCAHLRSMT